jgi:hypothetical protein
MAKTKAPAENGESREHRHGGTRAVLAVNSGEEPGILLNTAKKTSVRQEVTKSPGAS